jgi:hypothetical protein
MTEPTNPAPPEDKPPTLLKLGDLKKLITDTVEGAFKSREDKDPQPQPTPPRRTSTRREAETAGRSIDDEVAAAIKKLEAEKAERAEREALRKDVDDVKERTKEKPPVERRRVHRFMKWGE